MSESGEPTFVVDRRPDKLIQKFCKQDVCERRDKDVRPAKSKWETDDDEEELMEVDNVGTQSPNTKVDVTTKAGKVKEADLTRAGKVNDKDGEIYGGKGKSKKEKLKKKNESNEDGVGVEDCAIEAPSIEADLTKKIGKVSEKDGETCDGKGKSKKEKNKKKKTSNEDDVGEKDDAAESSGGEKKFDNVIADSNVDSGDDNEEDESDNETGTGSDYSTGSERESNSCMSESDSSECDSENCSACASSDDSNGSSSESESKSDNQGEHNDEKSESDENIQSGRQRTKTRNGKKTVAAKVVSKTDNVIIIEKESNADGRNVISESFDTEVLDGDVSRRKRHESEGSGIDMFEESCVESADVAVDKNLRTSEATLQDVSMFETSSDHSDKVVTDSTHIRKLFRDMPEKVDTSMQELAVIEKSSRLDDSANSAKSAKSIEDAQGKTENKSHVKEPGQKSSASSITNSKISVKASPGKKGSTLPSKKLEQALNCIKESSLEDVTDSQESVQSTMDREKNLNSPQKPARRSTQSTISTPKEQCSTRSHAKVYQHVLLFLMTSDFF